MTTTLQNVLTREFYDTIDTIISGDTPSITYLSDFFKIPLKKLRFVYILTNLKLGQKIYYMFE